MVRKDWGRKPIRAPFPTERADILGEKGDDEMGLGFAMPLSPPPQKPKLFCIQQLVNTIKLHDGIC